MKEFVTLLAWAMEPRQAIWVGWGALAFGAVGYAGSRSRGPAAFGLAICACAIGGVLFHTGPRVEDIPVNLAFLVPAALLLAAAASPACEVCTSCLEFYREKDRRR